MVWFIMLPQAGGQTLGAEGSPANPYFNYISFQKTAAFQFEPTCFAFRY